MEEDKVDWLKRMENGTIGEARTKSILIDRFWILERNVDINGADLLIQRQLTGRDINNPKPSKFGVVQAKFREKIPARIHIKKEYLLLGDKPRENFFLFVHTGKDNEKQAFFYTAEQLLKLMDDEFNFTIKESHSCNAINSPKVILDLIEKKLEKMDILDNYISFLSRDVSESYYHKDLERKKYKDIDEHYNVVLPQLGNFNDLINEARELADKFVSDYCEPLVETLNKMNLSSDPDEIYDLYEDFRDESRSSGLRDNQDYLNDAIKAFRSIEEKALDSGLRALCLNVREYISEDFQARDEKLLLEDYSYQIQLNSKDLLDKEVSVEFFSSIIKTPRKMLSEVKKHKESNNPREWYRKVYSLFDQDSTSEGSVKIIVHLSQSRPALRILKYQKIILEDNDWDFFNPQKELDKSKEDLISELIDRVLIIAVNRAFKDIEL